MNEQAALFAVVERRHGDQVLGRDIVPAGPPAAHLARAADSSASIEAADRAASSGRAGREARAVLECLRRHDGATSAELAQATAQLGLREFDQGPEAWRHTVARRLPGLEDEGLVYAVVPAFKVSKPHRVVNAHLVPCFVTATKSIRWYVQRPPEAER